MQNHEILWQNEILFYRINKFCKIMKFCDRIENVLLQKITETVHFTESWNSVTKLKKKKKYFFTECFILLTFCRILMFCDFLQQNLSILVQHFKYFQNYWFSSVKIDSCAECVFCNRILSHAECVQIAECIHSAIYPTCWRFAKCWHSEKFDHIAEFK